MEKNKILQYNKRRRDRLRARLANCADPLERLRILKAIYRVTSAARSDGGSGSGNWGHAGRPGSRGGSAPGGGSHNRISAPDGSYTSFSKQKKAMATPHISKASEVGKAPEGTKLVAKDGVWTKTALSDGSVCYIHEATGELKDIPEMYTHIKGQEVSYIVPVSANPNYQKVNRGSSGKAGDDFEASCFSEARKDNAFRPSSREEADEMYRENTGKAWQTFDEDTKFALNAYTDSAYRSINYSLRKNNFEDEYYADQADLITKAIDRVALPTDAYLARGVDMYGFEKLFGLKDGDLERSSGSLQSLVGLTGTDDGFMSCGTAAGSGFSADDVLLNIYCPSGTKAIYAEPFAKYGLGAGRHWDGSNADGKTAQSEFSGEFETILQRGSTLEITGIDYDGVQYAVDVQVTMQKPYDLAK